MIDMLIGQIELRHLFTFLAVAEERSFGRAAERLGYTQSAVSQQIATLERAAGIALFLRPGGPRPVELTDAGTELRSYANAVAAQMRAADDRLAALRSGERGRLRVGSFQSVSVKVLPPVARALATELPDVELDLLESDDPSTIVELIERRELDAGFLVGGHLDHEFEERLLFHDPYVVVAPPGTFPDGPVMSHDVVRHDLIGQPMNDVCQVDIDRGLRRAGHEPNVVFRSIDNAAVQAMARAGRGVAVMPRLSVDRHDPNISVHELADAVEPRTIVVVWREGPAVPPAVGRFVDLAIDVTRPLAEELTHPV